MVCFPSPMRTFVISVLGLSAICAASIALETSSAQTADKPQAKASVATPAPPKAAEVKVAQNKAANPAAPKPGAKTAAATPAPAAGKPGAAAAVATPAPATPKPGVLKRLFGRRPAPTPYPKPAAATPAPATPRPRAKVHHAATESEEAETPATEKTGETEKPAGTEKAKPAEPPPAASENASTEKTEPAAATPAPGKRGKRKGAAAEPKTTGSSAVDQAMASGDPDAIEKAKYNEAKTRALEDSHVKELKQKADTAATEEEGKKALRAYNKALFQKMRSVGDDSIHDRIDRMEAAVLRDLGE
jgi:hypothetical protein